MYSNLNLQSSSKVISNGGLVVYPTETVYGLGANALDSDCIERVFNLKSRDRSNPISFASSTVDRISEYVIISDKERAFMDEFLPGPVTVLCRKTKDVPDVLTSGNERVGVRIPDHPVTLKFLQKLDTPITSTSANLSGTGSVKNPEELSKEVRENVGGIIDIGTLEDGTESTVVDVDNEIIHRSGAIPTKVENWFNSR